MGLQEELDHMRPEIHTDSYSMSIGEWISVYERGELDIHPEFQRFFRWTDTQKTRFIESILLGIPIPPIFVSQQNSGVWDVIDGLQRLSTILQFVGILKDENDTLIPPLVLEETRHLPSLKGKMWERSDDELNSFDSAQRLYVKRSKLHVNIVLRESDAFAKFELFQRLNTGGSQLSDQEIRNCILVSSNRDMFNWMRALAQYENFRECTLLSERAMEEQYDLELVLRFLVLRPMEERELTAVGDLGEFLTNSMIKMAASSNYDRAAEEEAFKTTFDILHNATKEDSFRRYDPLKAKFVGGFLATPFEVFAMGIGYNYRQIRQSPADVRAKIIDFWKNPPVEIKAGSGIRASTRIPTTVPLGRRLFSP